MSRPRILVVGDVVDDVVVVPRHPIRADTDTDAVIQLRPGGSAANVAAWLGTAGARVDFVGRVAREDVDRHTAQLAVDGVRAHLVADRTLRTAAIVIVVADGHRTMLTQRGANNALTGDDVPDTVLDGHAHLHLTGYSMVVPASHDALRRLLKRAGQRHLSVSIDPASAGYLADLGPDQFWDLAGSVDVLLPNLDEGRLLTGRDEPAAVVEVLLERVPVVALTLGADGALVGVRGGGVPLHMPAVAATEVVDATGAGDAFAAGFLAAWTIGRDALAAAEQGVRFGAQAVATLGGRPPR